MVLVWTEGLGGDREKDGLFACSELSDPAQSEDAFSGRCSVSGQRQTERRCFWKGKSGLWKGERVHMNWIYAGRLRPTWIYVSVNTTTAVCLRMPYRNERGGKS